MQLLLWALCVRETAKSAGVAASSTLVLVFHVKLIINFNRCIDLILTLVRIIITLKKSLNIYKTGSQETSKYFIALQLNHSGINYETVNSIRCSSCFLCLFLLSDNQSEINIS